MLLLSDVKSLFSLKRCTRLGVVFAVFFEAFYFVGKKGAGISNRTVFENRYVLKQCRV